MSDRNITTRSSSQAIDRFIKQADKTPVVARREGRLIFALDATASRQPTWDTACQLQSELFLATRDLGGLAIQLVYYRGFKEFHASPWLTQTERLLKEMNRVTCLGGHTQIARVLKQAIRETREQAVKAVILVGDCCEEKADDLCQLAGELGMLRTPVFAFQEGHDIDAQRVFQQIAQLSGGAYVPFDHRSPAVLKDLLGAVAVYATGGKQALEDFQARHGGEVKRLTRQLK
ncbi:VWA domain-containing protein [Saccharospirillum salsuginis]|uniref:VWA domain-containing protein n=1 Tax=Saccharospirillum salsuginis TaxID=418750 RepID=A0A918KS23_9GAMM|nr:VWA domain-containing protein [Saccharospirillum salsuginis]GGX71288.1 hypothetical protein GCM10007392_43460 [Saccharospirillum salsuginis]